MIELSQHDPRGGPNRQLLRVHAHTFHQGKIHNQSVLADSGSRDRVAIAFHGYAKFSFPGELHAGDDVSLVQALRNQPRFAINSSIPYAPGVIISSVPLANHPAPQSLLEFPRVISGFRGGLLA
jgi:hypothetical protein